MREKHGLCYSVGTFTASYAEAGLFGVSTAVSREAEKKALALIREEIRRFLEDGLAPEELERARDLMKSNLIMAMESTSSRMSRLGASVLQLGPLPARRGDPPALRRRHRGGRAGAGQGHPGPGPSVFLRAGPALPRRRVSVPALLRELPSGTGQAPFHKRSAPPGFHTGPGRFIFSQNGSVSVPGELSAAHSAASPARDIP